jgi:hypothetical protein
VKEEDTLLIVTCVRDTCVEGVDTVETLRGIHFGERPRLRIENSDFF